MRSGATASANLLDLKVSRLLLAKAQPVASHVDFHRIPKGCDLDDLEGGPDREPHLLKANRCAALAAQADHSGFHSLLQIRKTHPFGWSRDLNYTFKYILTTPEFSLGDGIIFQDAYGAC